MQGPHPYMRAFANLFFSDQEGLMRAEAQKAVDSIQEALSLLRRYL